MKNLLKIFKFSVFIAIFFVVSSLPSLVSASYKYDSNIFDIEKIEQIQPFGYNLFTGQFKGEKDTGINDDYIIQSGDKITLSAWGEVSENAVVTVDNQGNIFIPDVGPVQVAGLKNSELNKKVQGRVKKVYPAGVEVYTDLLGSNPISVFVTGAVMKPGKYNGIATDSPLSYIDQAEGINQETGSYRSVDIKRSGKIIESFDIYNFLLHGDVPSTQLKDGDVIVVNKKGLSVAVEGEVKNRNIFEFHNFDSIGSKLVDYANINSSATNVAVTGFRERNPISKYFTLEEFKNFRLGDGDNVVFHSASHANKIKVYIEGEHLGPRVIIAPVDVGLVEILSQVRVDPEMSNFESVRIEREEVAVKQKISLENSLRRLEEVVFSAPQGATADELKFKAAEASLIQNFVKNARKVKPKGTIVVSFNGKAKDIKLKDGDKVIIPSNTNIVMVSGEVSIPSAIVFDKKYSYKSYIRKAGGFSSRANREDIIVVKASGESVAADNAVIESGDEIVVLPEIKVDRISIAKNIMDVIYKLVLSVAVPIKLIDD